MALGIDEIYEMLSWDQEETIQQQGIEEAKKIKHLSVLMQPVESKAIWENCARVLASKTDEELESYSYWLFEWLQDMNWPGAEIIYHRLLKMPKEWGLANCRSSISQAERIQDPVWKQVLMDFRHDLETSCD